MAERLKSGPCTTNVTVVECDNVPLVPVIVRGYVPTAVVDAVSSDGSEIQIRDMNGIAGWDRVGYSAWIPATTFQHFITP